MSHCCSICNGEALAASAGGIGPRTRRQRLDKLVMKRRRLRTERLKALTVGREQRRNGRRHLVLSRGQHPVVWVAAAALTSLREDPRLAKSVAAVLSTSDTATTNDI